MQDEIKPEYVGGLLRSTQQLRTHWSSAIIRLMGYAIALNTAIWTYLLKSYVESGVEMTEAKSKYIVLAAASSAMILGLWRLYTHYIDNRIAGLYPDFIFYEGILSVPYSYGTSRYLSENVSGVDIILSDKDLTYVQKSKAIMILVKSKHIGRRGHLAIEIFSLVVVVTMFLISLVASISSQSVQSPLNIICFFLMAIGILFISLSMFFYQRNPSEELIKGVVPSLKQDTKNGAK